MLSKEINWLHRLVRVKGIPNAPIMLVIEDMHFYDSPGGTMVRQLVYQVKCRWFRTDHGAVEAVFYREALELVEG